MIQKRRDSEFITELNKKTSDYGLENTLMLVDLFDLKTRESKSICDKDPKIRNEAIVEHKEWIDVAKSIGCSSIRVNLWSKEMNAKEVKKISEEGLGKLLEYSSINDMSIAIENHGGFTSDGLCLANLMKSINHPNLGTLPDFCVHLIFVLKEQHLEKEKMYSPNLSLTQHDKYKGVEEMPSICQTV
jgi:Xylose isomerase-like TIM barrel.